MFERGHQISPQAIKQFSNSLQKNKYTLKHFSLFYKQYLQPLYQQPELSYPFSESLFSLSQQLITILQHQPDEAISICPKIYQILKQTIEYIHPRYALYLNELINNPKSYKNQKQIIRQQRQKVEDKQELVQRFKCLGCTQYFLQNQNIWHKGITDTHLIVINTVKKIKKYQAQIKKALGGLVNGPGGVILFACYQEKQKIVAYGQVISESTKESILQQLREVFQSFMPKLTFSENAHLSFVPIGKYMFSNIQYIPGMFVTRLRIWDKNRQNFYFWSNGEQIYLSTPHSVQKGLQLNVFQQYGKHAIKSWKTHYRHFYIPESWQKRQNLLVRKQHFFTTHSCKNPYLGAVIAREKDHQKQQNQYLLQQSFPYTSVVFLSKVPLPKIISYLVSQKISSFQFSCPNSPILNQKLVQLLFHSTSPYKLQEIFKRISHNDKKPLFLIIDNSILMKKLLKKEQFIEIYQFLCEIHPQQHLNYYQNKDRNEGIVQASSKVSIFILFMKLREKGISGLKFIKIDKELKLFSLKFSSSDSLQ